MNVLYKNFRCASGNSDAIIKDDAGTTCEILALSNKLQIASDDEKMRLILTGLECGQTVPGAPFPEQIDTFYTLWKVEELIGAPWRVTKN